MAYQFSQERWDQIFGKVDDSKFSPKQLEKLETGRHLDLPVQIYADPSFTPEQMHKIMTMLETTFEALQEPNKRLTCTDYGPAELEHYFNSFSNFVHHPERVCYIPSNWDFEEDGPGYTGNDILELCGGDPIKAKMVFSLCTWQHPSTVLDEFDEDDERALLEKHREAAAQRIHEKTGWPMDTCLEEVRQFTYEELLHGYFICSSDAYCSGSLIPEAEYIERIDALMRYDSDYDAAKQAEKDGIKIIHDMPGLEDWTYLDTPENRALCAQYLEANKPPIQQLLSSAQCSKTTESIQPRQAASQARTI